MVFSERITPLMIHLQVAEGLSYLVNSEG